jgi:hypothetical protein
MRLHVPEASLPILNRKGVRKSVLTVRPPASSTEDTRIDAGLWCSKEGPCEARAALSPT